MEHRETIVKKRMRVFSNWLNRKKRVVATILAIIAAVELYLAYQWRESNKEKIDITTSEISCYHYKRDRYGLQFVSSDGTKRIMQKPFRDCDSQIKNISNKTLVASSLVNNNIIYRLEVDGSVFYSVGKPRFAFYWAALFLFTIVYVPIYRKYAKKNT